jgi:Na+/H+ antiporter NhaA
MQSEKSYLLYLHIVPFLCWAFDVLTTLYVIDYLGVAEELNPLGWPFGAWGALMFYIPALIFTYLLLSRVQSRYSTWAAVSITAVALGIGVMNLLAGIHNVGVADLYT